MAKKDKTVVAEVEVDEAEAKAQRKAAKRAAKEAAAAAAEAEAPAEEEAPKKGKKAKKAAVVEEAPAEEIDEAEAKRQRKAAKKAAKQAAAEAEAAPAEEIDEAEAKKQRKAAKKAAAAAAAAEAEEEAPKAKKDKKRPAEDADEEEAPKAKKPTLEVNDEDDRNKLKVFVRGLPFSVDETVLRKDFTECGEIEDLKMPMNDEGRPKGIAFIKYATQAGFDAALKFDNTDYGGRTIFVSKAGEGGKGKDGKGKDGKGKGKDGKGKDGKGGNELTVFVRGLPFSVEEATITKDFAECGEIETLRLPMNDEGKPRGICFIKYKTQEGMDAALKFDNTDYGGRTINVSKAGEGGKGKDGKGKDGKGKDGKGKDGKGKGKKGKGKAPSEAKAKSSGCIVAGEGEKKTFDDSDDE